MKTLFILLALFVILFTPVYGVVINGIAAKAGDSVITIHEFSTMYEWETHMALMMGRLAPTKKAVMDSLIDDLLIRNEAENRGIVVGQKELDAIIDDIKKQNNMSDEEFERALEEEKITVEDLIEKYRSEILTARLISQMVSITGERISDKEIRDFYDDPQNRRLFRVPPMVKLSQIFIAVGKDTSYQNSKELKELTMKVHQMAQEGQDFQDLVRQYSTAPGKEKNRGYLGSFTAEQLRTLMKSEDVELIFSLEAGEIVPPVRLEDGYYIFKVEEKIEEKQLSFEEAYENIKSYLLKQKGDKLFNAWLVEKKEKTKIHYMIELE